MGNEEQLEQMRAQIEQLKQNMAVLQKEKQASEPRISKPKPTRPKVHPHARAFQTQWVHPSLRTQKQDDTNETATEFVYKKSGGSMSLVNKDIYKQEEEKRAKQVELARLKMVLRQRQVEKQKKEAVFRKNKAKYAGCQWENLYGEDSEQAKAGFGNYAVAHKGLRLFPISLDPAQDNMGEVVGFKGHKYVRTPEGLVSSTMSLNQPQYCQNYTSSGTCWKLPKCRYMHSREHRALCRSFVSNKCPHTDESCRLSHQANQFNAPACKFFMSGYCSKPKCPFGHVKVAEDAKICRPFAIVGWCDEGALCKYRHVYECPDFIDYGEAHSPTKCGLSHRKQKRIFLMDGEGKENDGGFGLAQNLDYVRLDWEEKEGGEGEEEKEGKEEGEEEGEEEEERGEGKEPERENSSENKEIKEKEEKQ